ncbi:MAG TPA: wax ester/triacylglycerol synthase domain-containing protein [Streptosporangiaceae bacterium]|nr:wax ester/triacylglycerol synthase domain-containing protein [Streptosporangiaceae bacterium]
MPGSPCTTSTRLSPRRLDQRVQDTALSTPTCQPRQLLYVPRPGLGRPLWVDAPAFDLSDHMRVVPVPAPGEEAGLLRVAEQLRRVRLDRSRPLWQMWLLPGLPEGRVWRRAFSGCQKGEGKPCLSQTSDTRSPD